MKGVTFAVRVQERWKDLHGGFVAAVTIGAGVGDARRMPKTNQKIWLSKIFNICVDKRVENSRSSNANYTVLSTLERFAQFLCSLSTNKFEVGPSWGRNSWTIFLKSLIFNTSAAVFLGGS